MARERACARDGMFLSIFRFICWLLMRFKFLACSHVLMCFKLKCTGLKLCLCLSGAMSVGGVTRQRRRKDTGMKTLLPQTKIDISATRWRQNFVRQCSVEHDNSLVPMSCFLSCSWLCAFLRQTPTPPPSLDAAFFGRQKGNSTRQRRKTSSTWQSLDFCVSA